MGSREVLGQAARLASSGLLLQVLSARPAPARPAAGMHGEADLGPLSARPGALRVPAWTPLIEGLDRRRWRRRRGAWAWSAELWLGGCKQVTFRSERCISHMVVGVGSGGRGAFGALESDAFKGRSSLSPCPIADPQTPFSNALTPTEFRETVWHN